MIDQITVQPRYDDIDTTAPDYYWHHYQGQHEHQTVVLSLDTHDGEMLIDIDPRVGGGTPTDVWTGRVLWFPLPYIPTPAAANALINRVTPMAQAVLNAAADNVDDESERALAEYLDSGAGLDDADIVAVWTLDGIDEVAGVTAEMTDEDLHAYGRQILSELAATTGHPVAVCSGLDHWLRSLRDTMRDAATA